MEKSLVSDDAQLRSLYASPKYLAMLDQLDDTCRLFIAQSPLVILATTQPNNGIDVSPRGDAPGFVHVLDDHTLLIPDRTGNNRLDSMGNLLVNDEIGLLFLIPGVHESLRVKGTTRISHDPDLTARFVIGDKQPKTVLVVTVCLAFIHCGKALNRSRIWESDYRVSLRDWKLQCPPVIT